MGGEKNKTILFTMYNITSNRVPVLAALSKSDKFVIKYLFQRKNCSNILL